MPGIVERIECDLPTNAPAMPAIALAKTAGSMAASHGPALLLTPETTKLARTGVSQLTNIASLGERWMTLSELKLTRDEMPAVALDMLLGCHARKPIAR